MVEGGLSTSDQSVVTDANEFVHGTTKPVLRNDDWARDTINLTKARLAVLIAG